MVGTLGLPISLTMASTRKQKAKAKSLCMTDFFANNDQPNHTSGIAANLELSNPPPTQLQDGDMLEMDKSPGSASPVASQPSPASSMSPKKKLSGLKRGSNIPVPTRHTSSPQGDRTTGYDSTSPLTHSPQKHRAKLDTEFEELRSLSPTADPTPPHTEDILDTFPTSNQAVSDLILKDMMLALRSSIQQSFKNALHHHMAALDDLGERVNHIETKMGEFSEAHNGLVDAHNHLEDEMSSLAAKLTDLEDRNRRNNIKFRGVPESVPPADLVPFLQRLIKSVLPEVTTHDLVIDRAHRLPKPKSIPESAPRDVIARIHFYHIKEELMQTARKLPQLPDPFHQVHLFADLSQATLQARKHLTPITTALRQKNIMYRWGFPTRIIVTRNGVTHIIRTLEEGTSALKALGIEPPPPSVESSRRQEAAKVSSDWSLAKGHT